MGSPIAGARSLPASFLAQVKERRAARNGQRRIRPSRQATASTPYLREWAPPTTADQRRQRRVHGCVSAANAPSLPPAHGALLA